MSGPGGIVSVVKPRSGGLSLAQVSRFWAGFLSAHDTSIRDIDPISSVAGN